MEYSIGMIASGRSDLSLLSGHQKGYELTDRRTQAHRIYCINSPHALYSGFTQLYATRANPTSKNPPSNLTGGGINGLSFTGRRGGSFLFVEMHISPGGTAKFRQLFNDVWGEGVLMLTHAGVVKP